MTDYNVNDLRQEIKKDISGIHSRLDKIVETLSQVAVQSNQISTLQSENQQLRNEVDGLWEKLEPIKEWQQSCPRRSIKWVYAILVPIAGLQITQAYALVRLILSTT